MASQHAWYESLPKTLASLIPRVVDFSSDGAEASISLEFIGYNTLEEAWVYQNLPADVWKAILRHLLDILARFRQYRGSLARADFDEMYKKKVEQRLASLTGPPWESLLGLRSLRVNGEPLRGYPDLWPTLGPRIDNLYNPDHVTLIHGDFQFANILYDLNSRLAKLIDPRGKFGQPGICGDCKYDLAKLRHSLSGGYNHIVNDLFSVSLNEDSMEIAICGADHQDGLIEWFDREVERSGFSPSDIRLIEGLLFLSMIPLHSDHPDRQLAMFGTALKLLNT